MVAQNTATDGTCDATGCDEPAPGDMPALIVDDAWFCSPDCARDYLDELAAAPGSVVLHDPQFAVDRDALPAAVGDHDVDIRRPVDSMDGARTAIDDAEDLFPAAFRVELHE